MQHVTQVQEMLLIAVKRIATKIIQGYKKQFEVQQHFGLQLGFTIEAPPGKNHVRVGLSTASYNS